LGKLRTAEISSAKGDLELNLIDLIKSRSQSEQPVAPQTEVSNTQAPQTEVEEVDIAAAKRKELEKQQHTQVEVTTPSKNAEDEAADRIDSSLN